MAEDDGQVDHSAKASSASIIAITTRRVRHRFQLVTDSDTKTHGSESWCYLKPYRDRAPIRPVSG